MHKNVVWMVLGLALAGAGCAGEPNGRGLAGDGTDGKADAVTNGGLFPDSLDKLPSDYEGPVFHLSQAYPKTMPSIDVSQLPWARIDFRTDPDAYLMAIRRYFYEQLHVLDEAGQLIGQGPQEFQVTTLFGMPWMHTGSNRREGVHGFTRELDAPPGRLAATQTALAQDWGVGFYNALGGYAIGRVFSGPKQADLRSGNAQFPEGTAVTKLLWTSATPEQVPWLDGAVTWQANINSTASRFSPRKLQEVRLIQMDVAIKDERAGRTGWVFGTFVYDSQASASDAGGTDGWQRMMPLGVAWGNDPGISATDVAAGKTLSETLLASHAPAVARRSLGWGGRLNGPADNPDSSCVSCHSTAEWPNGPLNPSANSTEAERLRFFRNLAGDEPFDPGRTALDFSQQFSVSLANLKQASGTILVE